jgi:hypothetical protein
MAESLKKLLTRLASSHIISALIERTNTNKKEKYMSAYTDKMVNELKAVDSWNYDKAADYAALHSLSVRSVISKLKNLGLAYEPKPIVKAASPRIRKADIVVQIAEALGMADNAEALAGLEKADARSLQTVLKQLPC